jgi:hypothetical protein
LAGVVAAWVSLGIFEGPNEAVEKLDLQSGFSCFVLVSQSVIEFSLLLPSVTNAMEQ